MLHEVFNFYATVPLTWIKVPKGRRWFIGRQDYSLHPEHIYSTSALNAKLCPPWPLGGVLSRANRSPRAVIVAIRHFCVPTSILIAHPESEPMSFRHRHPQYVGDTVAIQHVACPDLWVSAVRPWVHLARRHLIVHKRGTAVQCQPGLRPRRREHVCTLRRRVNEVERSLTIHPIEYGPYFGDFGCGHKVPGQVIHTMTGSTAPYPTSTISEGAACLPAFLGTRHINSGAGYPKHTF